VIFLSCITPISQHSEYEMVIPNFRLNSYNIFFMKTDFLLNINSFSVFRRVQRLRGQLDANIILAYVMVRWTRTEQRRTACGRSRLEAQPRPASFLRFLRLLQVRSSSLQNNLYPFKIQTTYLICQYPEFCRGSTTVPYLIE
jgi:hypothetical protein